MGVKLVKDFDEFLKLRQPWNELAVQCEVDHAFMRHEWFSCWIKHLGDPRKIRIITLWSDGQLVAAAPMQIGREVKHKIPFRMLSFLASSITPRCNFIIHPSFDKQQLFEELFRIKGWDIIFASNLESNLDITRKFIEFLDSRSGAQYDVKPGRSSPYEIINFSWDDYLKSLSKNHRKNIRVALKRLEGAKSSSFEHYDESHISKGLFAKLVAISGASWKASEGTDLLSNKKIASFYEEFTREGSASGLWKIVLVKIDDNYTAFDYYLKHGNSITGIRSDYVLPFKEYAPGHLAKISTIRDLCSKGEPWEYDMGGMAAEYKLGYVKKIREHLHITAASSSPYGKIILFGQKKIWPFLKGLGKTSAPASVAEQQPSGEMGDESSGT